MSKRHTTYLGVALGIIVFVAIGMRLTGSVPGSGTSISISDDGRRLSVSAEFPRSESEAVHDYVRKQLEINDLPDMSHVEIKHYKTPGMRFQIKTRDRFVRIVMDKKENSREAYFRLKATAEGLKKILTDP